MLVLRPDGPPLPHWTQLESVCCDDPWRQQQKRTSNRSTLLGRRVAYILFIFIFLRRSGDRFDLSQSTLCLFFWIFQRFGISFAAVHSQSRALHVPTLGLHFFPPHILHISETCENCLFMTADRQNKKKRILRQPSLVMFVFPRQTFTMTILSGLFFCSRASSVGSFLQQKSGFYFPRGRDAHRTEGPLKVKVFSKLSRHRGRRQREMKSQNLGRPDNICVYIGAASVRLCIWQRAGMCEYCKKYRFNCPCSDFIKIPTLLKNDLA